MVVAESGTKPTAHQPTPDEWEEGPVVLLERPGWVNYNWSPHGYAYSIRFDADAKAVAFKAHFDMWVGPENAAVNGITVTEGAAHKKPTAKKPAAKKPRQSRRPKK